MRQLVEHGADIRQWLSTEPTLDKKRLCTLMLEEKGYHVRPKTAENYLIRLRRGPITRRRMTVRMKISRKRKPRTTMDVPYKRRRNSWFRMSWHHLPRTTDIRGPIALWSTVSPQTRSSCRLSDLYTPRRLQPGRVSPHESDDELLDAIRTYENQGRPGRVSPHESDDELLEAIGAYENQAREL